MDRKELKSRGKKMFGLIEVWKKSGLSQAVFCREHGIAPSTFRDWYKRYKTAKAQSTSSTNGFVSLKPEKIQNQVLEAELVFPNGICLRLHQPVEGSFLTKLINTCSNA